MTAQPTRGVCSVCRTDRKLNEHGLVRLHRRHGNVCDGSARVPRQREQRKPGWGSIRQQVIARDVRCLKCGSSTGLDVHHKLERVYGGSDDLANLVALCSLCHDEWTWCQPGTLTFDTWLGVLPARILVGVFATPWPTDVSAAAFKEQLIAVHNLVVTEHERGRK